jgi:hypothetical protein
MKRHHAGLSDINHSRLRAAFCFWIFAFWKRVQWARAMVAHGPSPLNQLS